MDIDIKSNDEIGEIYQGIRSMQMRIIDYIKDMLVLEEGKKKAENDLKDKEERIDQLSVETYKDALTGVGNNAAYIKKVEEINDEVKESDLEFALVMLDINNLKNINDEFGHRSGDIYIKGCCRMICDTYKHSPVYRIGGDEFVVVLLGADYTNRKPLLEQLKADFERTYEQTDVPPWERFSAAVGMADKASNDLSTEFVFRRADAAMYKDKDRFKKKHNLHQSR
jgi:diguanylate cyclase (GGDEF)-like protein